MLSAAGHPGSPRALRHHVLFRFREDAGAGERARFDAGLRRLLAESEGVRSARVVDDAGLRPGHPRAADRLLIADFESPEAFAAYLAGDAHRRFLASPAAVCETVISLQHHHHGKDCDA